MKSMCKIVTADGTEIPMEYRKVYLLQPSQAPDSKHDTVLIMDPTNDDGATQRLCARVVAFPQEFEPGYES